MSHRAKYYGHRDANHGEIVRALESIGCSVWDISGAAGKTDLIAHNLGDVRWLSIEDGTPGKGTGRHIAAFILDPREARGG